MGQRNLVRDLMTVGVPTCPPQTPIVDLTAKMLELDWESVIVLHEGHAVGFVDRNMIVQAYTDENNDQLCAEDIMDAAVPIIPPDIPLSAAAQLMQDMGVRQVFMMHHADGITYPAAYLSYRHLLRHLIADDNDDLNDLGIKADRLSPIELFIKRRDAARRNASTFDQE